MTFAADGVELRASEIAYNELLERIVDLRLPPGSVINEKAMGMSLGLGRMPVREAIARLATGRFLTVLPRRGAVVSPIGLADVLDMFEAREAIECGVVYIVAERATTEELATLRDLVARADSARTGTDHEIYLRTDHAVHAYLVHMVHNGLLQDAADRLLLHNLRFWHLYWSNRPAQPSTMMSHTHLVEALEAHDAEGAARAMRSHLVASRALVQEAF
ncbi:GntR family transcriptional regulator [Frigoribacterium sp. UYMn621]|jgi:DNA-binding GntR family transcriptional regulator|uniref:GntR family transcriptional regulator n=1 Tax=Frigoribacterium sp. UYMn621 TaxID=3156343 RepID=UPI003394037A